MPNAYSLSRMVAVVAHPLPTALDDHVTLVVEIVTAALSVQETWCVDLTIVPLSILMLPTTSIVLGIAVYHLLDDIKDHEDLSKYC